MPRVPKVHIRDTEIGQAEVFSDNDRYGNFFTQSDTVAELDFDSFDDYLEKKDAVLVLFYEQKLPDSSFAKMHVEMASQITKRPKSGYAGVNCAEEPFICDNENVVAIPFFKLYSRGNVVSSIGEYSGFTAELMKQYVEKCPVLEAYVRPRRLCDLSEVDPQPKTKVANTKPVWPSQKEPKRKFKLLNRWKK